MRAPLLPPATSTPPPATSPPRPLQLEKRLKSGKISKADYRKEMASLNRELGLSDDDDEVLLGGGAPAAAAAAAAGGGDDAAPAAKPPPRPFGGRPPAHKRTKR